MENKIKGTIIGAAAGDALGWITEFIKSPEQLSSSLGVNRVTSYHLWSKRVGGRFFGYLDNIAAGDYSDDTQLTICTAASISTDGSFDCDIFSNKEFPLWLEYARGGGGTVKEAAEKIQRKSARWNNNFFTRRTKDGVIDYRDGGANGAAMRISPHVLANVNRWQQASDDIWRNSIISHGHPRAIIGALLYGYALYTVLHWSKVNTGFDLITTLGNWVKQLEIPCFKELKSWESQWNNAAIKPFEQVFADTVSEAVEQLRLVFKAIKNEESPESVLKKLGCFDYHSKGSGLATAIAGIYLFARQPEKTEENIIIAANMLGSDTDSIAAFVGGLAGATMGIETIPLQWRSQLQDIQFLTQVGEYLAKVSDNQATSNLIRPDLNNILFKQGISRLTTEKNLPVIHCRLGKGIITNVDVQSLLTKDKTVTIIDIIFDIGQSCKFALRTDSQSQTLANY